MDPIIPPGAMLLTWERKVDVEKEGIPMVLPKDAFQMRVQNQVLDSWRELVSSIERSVVLLEQGLDEAAEMRDICTDEWCVATEHVLDDLSNALFSISEPRWASDEDSRKIKDLKGRVHELYSKYKAVRTTPPRS
jgi:hypothetical protein